MANDLSTGNYPSPIDQYFAGELHLYQYIYIYIYILYHVYLHYFMYHYISITVA